MLNILIILYKKKAFVILIDIYDLSLQIFPMKCSKKNLWRYIIDYDMFGFIKVELNLLEVKT
jgi:hypothetical protein